MPFPPLIGRGTAQTTMSRHVEIFREDFRGSWGWQCFTCGGESGALFGSAFRAERDSEQHACPRSETVPDDV